MRACGGKERTLDEVRSFAGNGIAMLIRRSASGASEKTIQKALEIFKEYYKDHCQVKTKPYDGILEMLRTLEENQVKTAIVSNKADFAVKELQKIYFTDSIPIAIGENEAAGIQKKPAPEMVYKALEELDSKPEEAVYIGDSEVDIETAKNSGMNAIIVTWGFREKEYLKKQGATVVVDSAKELEREVLG